MDAFQKTILANYSFNELCVPLENICKGRLGSVLVQPDGSNIPIVRTTTVYEKSQIFKPIHLKIIDDISKITNTSFNNALIEIYDDSYCNMGFHSDQALDLADNSYICLFSCYETEPTNYRKLKIQNKKTKELSEVILENNSVVLFSTKTNREYLHKIVLEKHSNTRWLGITFRLSKTFVNFIDGKPYVNDKLLRLATDEEKKEFFKLKNRENIDCEKPPDIEYTISGSDLKQLA